MARKKAPKVALAPRGDSTGLAAIRIWTMQIETAMVRRYIGNGPTLDEIQRIASETLKKLKGIKPAMVSDCPGWDHTPDCECMPPPL
ncbi:MAG: hypothetical protein ABI672_01940 [Vicinamibacteria bacterium]